MAIETFDDFNAEENYGSHQGQKPFQFREDTSDKGTLDWLVENFNTLSEKSQSRIISYQRWSLMYKGIHWRRSDVSTRDSNRDGTFSSEKKPKMVDNFIYEFIDSRVSQVARFNSNFACIPWNGEASDINNAESCDKLLRARSEDIGLDSKHRKADRIKYKYGNVFQYVGWNEDMGPYLPEYKSTIRYD